MYDRLMDHVDYGEWARYIASVYARFGTHSTTKRMIDGGCGTGSLMDALVRKGFSIVGFDRSFGMVHYANQKTGCSVWRGDLCDLALKNGWDAFICLYDTIQYLNSEQIIRFLEQVKKLLKPGGLVVFDVVTEAHVKKYWNNYTETVAEKDWKLQRRTWYDRPAKILNTDFDIWSRVDGILYRERHQQHIYALDDLSGCWIDKGWSLLARHDGFCFKEGGESSDRVHFILKKEED